MTLTTSRNSKRHGTKYDTSYPPSKSFFSRPPRRKYFEFEVADPKEKRSRGKRGPNDKQRRVSRRKTFLVVRTKTIIDKVLENLVTRFWRLIKSDDVLVSSRVRRQE